MDENAKICRLCLKIIAEDVPYFPLTSNNTALQNLSSISSLTIKHLHLIENPVICDVCNRNLKQLAGFKDNIVSNELEIQYNQVENSNLFLEALSKDLEKICRLCLKTSEDPTDLQIEWKVMKEMFTSCNIHLNFQITVPSKMCDTCATMAENMWTFVSDCSENAKHIENLFNKDKRLSVKDLLEIVPNRVEILERNEDNNNVSRERSNENVPGQSKENLSRKKRSADKTTNRAVKCAKKSFKKAKGRSKNASPGTETALKKVASELIHLNLCDSNQDQATNSKKNTEAAGEEALIFNRTPKTYTRARSRMLQKPHAIASTSKLNILSHMCITKQSKPSTSKPASSETIIGDACIDVSPVINIADITLELTQGRVIQTDSGDNNVTQELIELLEETEEPVVNGREENSSGNNKHYKNAEELLKILEDDGDGSVIEANTEQGKGELKKDEKEKSGGDWVAETAGEGTSGLSQDQKTQVEDLIGTITNNLVVKKTALQKRVYKNKKAPIIADKGSKSGIQTETKRKSSRQKSIVMSFREMLNMKPLKNKASESKENLADVAGTSENIEETQVQELRVEDKKSKEENPALAKSAVKKAHAKKPSKKATECQETEVLNKQAKKVFKTKKAVIGNLQEVLENSEELPNNATVSQIEQVNFEKVKMQQISLMDEKSKVLQTQTKTIKKKEAIKRAPKRETKKITDFDGFNRAATNDPKNAEKTTPISAPEESQNATEVQEVSVVARKKTGKRKAGAENEKESVPRKQAKRTSQTKLPRNSKELNTENKESLVNEEGSKPEKTNTNTNTEIKADVAPQNRQDAESDYSEHDYSENIIQGPDKPIVVTIIRRKGTKNKAERDKMWLELVGKEGRKEVPQKDEVPKKKRGRKPLPESAKKPKKPKPVYFMCDSCSFKSLSQNIIIQHQYLHNVVDKVVQFKCSQCHFWTTTEDLLEQHKGTHVTLDVIYKCMFCEFMHKKKNSTMYHTLRHEDRDIANMFYCLVLNQITEEETYECFQCEYQNSEEAVMPDHVIDHQVEKIKNSVLAKFSCKECSYKTKFEETFKRHKKIHDEGKKLKVTRRKEANKEQDGKEKEVKRETEEVSEEIEEVSEETEGVQTENGSQDEALTVYSCNLCSYLTYNKRSLTNHKGLKHTRHEPDYHNKSKKKAPEPGEIYRCNECPYTTQKKPHLSRHVVVHRSKENMEFFECPYCIFETKHRRSYKRHLEIRHQVIV